MARRAKKRIKSIDFTGVESGGGSVHIEPGTYRLKVDSVEEDTSSNDNEMFVWIFKGVDGAAKNKKFWYYTTLTPESLWKLRSLLEAMGVDVPDSVMDLDLDEMVGLEVMGSIDDDEYQGKVRSKMVDHAPVSTESSTKSNSKSKASLTADEVQEMDEEELIDVVAKHKLDIDLDDFKTVRRKASAVIAALEEEGALAE